MSQTLTTADMVADLQQRIPMGLDSNYCMAQINKAMRWIEQQGAFTWNVAYSDITVRQGTFWVDPADMPDQFDSGKPCTIYGQTFSSVYGSHGAEIPYVAPDRLALHELYHVRLPRGVFSVFTVVTNLGTVTLGPATDAYPDEVPFLLMAPSSALHTTEDCAYHFVYHQIPVVTLAAGPVYYPTPDPFDDLIVDLAEGEIKRIYQFGGWAEAIKKAQNSTLLLLDKYRSPKLEMAGITEQAKETQESQLKRAE